MFSEEILKQYGSFAGLLPDKPVSAGDAWSVSRQEVSPIGLVKVDVKFTFKGWEQHGDRKCAHITGSGRIWSQKDPANPNNSFEIKKGETSGDVWFDAELGMVVDSSSDQNLTLKVMARGQALESKLSQKLHFVLADSEQKP